MVAVSILLLGIDLSLASWVYQLFLCSVVNLRRFNVIIQRVTDVVLDLALVVSSHAERSMFDSVGDLEPVTTHRFVFSGQEHLCIASRNHVVKSFEKVTLSRDAIHVYVSWRVSPVLPAIACCSWYENAL